MNNFAICFWCTERCNEGPRHSSGRRRKISSKRKKCSACPINTQPVRHSPQLNDVNKRNARAASGFAEEKMLTVIHMLGLILIKMLHLVHDHASAQMWSIANQKRQKHARRPPSRSIVRPGRARQRRIFMTMLERNANANHRFVAIRLAIATWIVALLLLGRGLERRRRPEREGAGKNRRAD